MDVFMIISIILALVIVYHVTIQMPNYVHKNDIKNILPIKKSPGKDDQTYKVMDVGHI